MERTRAWWRSCRGPRRALLRAVLAGAAGTGLGAAWFVDRDAAANKARKKRRKRCRKQCKKDHKQCKRACDLLPDGDHDTCQHECKIAHKQCKKTC